MATEPPDDRSTGLPDPDRISSRSELAAALTALKGPLAYAAITAAAGDLTRSQAHATSGRTDWTPEPLTRGGVSDWLSGRTLPTTNRLLTFLVVCAVPSADINQWLAAVERVRTLPAATPAPVGPTAPAPPDTDTGAPTTPDSRRPLRLLLGVVGLIVLVAASVTIFFVSTRSSSNGGGGTSPTDTLAAPTRGSAPATSAPTMGTASNSPAGTTPSTAAPAGQAAITAVYNAPGGCSTTAMVTIDLHGDPRAAGNALWIVGVLSAPPNVLYYPEMRITLQNGHVTMPIKVNAQSGERIGRFGLVVSPTDQADNDLQTSLQGDQAQSDSIYPDSRRVHLQDGNLELAATPFVTQRC